MPHQAMAQAAKTYSFGLALVKRLVESLKGTFNIISTQGDGATVEVKIPRPPKQKK